MKDRNCGENRRFSRIGWILVIDHSGFSFTRSRSERLQAIIRVPGGSDSRCVVSAVVTEVIRLAALVPIATGRLAEFLDVSW